MPVKKAAKKVAKKVAKKAPAKKATVKKAAAKKAPAKKASAKALKCPRDKKVLERFVHGRGHADKFSCNTCAGFWITGPALKKDTADGIVKLPAGLVEGLKPTKSSAKALKCPEDGTQMIKVKSARDAKIGDVIMDACPKCKGIWFDQSEYGHIITKKGNVPVGPSVFNSILVFLARMDKQSVN